MTETTIRKPWWAWAAQIALPLSVAALFWMGWRLWETRNG